MAELYQNLLVEKQSGITTVTLNRPELHNAFNDEMIAELIDCFSRLAQDIQTRVVVLTGAGKSFCAGADLNWMKKMAGYSFQENELDAMQLHRMLLQIDLFPKPVVGRINGSAIGGGVGLVSVSDMAFAVHGAEFGFSEVRLGLVPAVISPFVLQKIGAAAAREYFLTGERFGTDRAREMGLLQGAGTAEELEAWLQKKLQALCAGGSEALAESKRLIRDGLLQTPEAAGERTARIIAERRSSQEGREGIESFLNKRRPRWVEPLE